MNRKIYIYQQDGWPNFIWNINEISDLLAEVRNKQGRLIGKMEALGFDLQNEAFLETLTADILKSNEIEGIVLNKEEVRSSIARRLGIDVGGLPAINRNIEGIVDMMFDATKNFDKPLKKRDYLIGIMLCFQWVEAGCMRLSLETGEMIQPDQCRLSPVQWVKKRFITKHHLQK